jgi:beta-glucosidase
MPFKNILWKNPDLGIPIIPFDEALHGLMREGTTAFPQAIGLSATFNPELMKEVSSNCQRI